MLKKQNDNANEDIKLRFEDKVIKIKQGDDLLPTVMKVVKVFDIQILRVFVYEEKWRCGINYWRTWISWRKNC